MDKRKVAIAAYVVAIVAAVAVTVGWTLGPVVLVGVALAAIAVGLLASL